MLSYCERIERGVTILAGDEAHHLIHVLRSHIGDIIKLFDGKGIAAAGVILRTVKDRVEIAVDRVETHTPKVGGRVIIAASVAKGERFDWLVSKCTELGVDRIYPVLFERTVKQAGGRSIERYNKLALAAAKQCERIFLPVIDPPMPLDECLRQLSQSYPKASLLFGAMDAKAGTIVEKTRDFQDYAAFIGPEGGLTEKEEEVLRNYGAVGVRLTRTILRIETAAVAFASILCVSTNNRDPKAT